MTNWKTTLTGAVLAIIVAVQPIIETGSIDWKKLAFASVIALFGYLTKDIEK
jgi:hypothetical protein